MWLSKSSKSQTSKSILLISPLSAYKFFSCFTEMFRRMSFMNHINFSSFCVETAENLVFKVGLISSFSAQSLGSSSPEFNSFKIFNMKSICPIFFRISQEALNIYISLLVKLGLILLGIFLTLILSVGLCAELFCNQLCHSKFHVISLATMFLCPKITSK